MRFPLILFGVVVVCVGGFFAAMKIYDATTKVASSPTPEVKIGQVVYHTAPRAPDQALPQKADNKEQRQNREQVAREAKNPLNACEQLVAWFCDFAPGTPRVVLKEKQERVPSHCEDYKGFADDSIHGSSAFVREGSLRKCEAERKATLEMNTLFE